VIACGLPQLVWVLSVIYRQLKGNQVARYIAGKFCTLVKQILKRNKVGDELSDANPLHHQNLMINPNQYNRPLLSDTEQVHMNSETHSIPGQVPPVYTYGSISLSYNYIINRYSVVVNYLLK